MKLRDRTYLGGAFEVTCYDQFGNLKWVDKAHNIITDEGENANMDIMFGGSTQITPWYCILSETDNVPSGTMTYLVPVFTETTAYDEATRPAYTEANSIGGTVTNSANKAVFTISATKTMYGAALVGGGTADQVKGNTNGGGRLWSFGTFTASRAVVDNDVINLTYVVSAADDGV